MAADGTGGRPVGSPSDPAPRAPRLNALLYAVALVLACACVVGGVGVSRAHDDRQHAQAEQERYGEVIDAASAQAEALVNIDYRDLQTTYDTVVAGATGAFLEGYTGSWEKQVERFEQTRSVSTGTVLEAAVSDIDEDSATVMVAIRGEARNTATGERPQQRRFRWRLDVVRVDGEWLAQGVELVG